MTDQSGLRVLFSEQEIVARVDSLAAEIARQSDPPSLALPILTGAFVFAADLVRALDRRGLSLPVEFLQLRSYGSFRAAQGEVRVLADPGQIVRGHHVVLIDGVLDCGHTLTKGRALALASGARRVTTAVAVDKCRKDARLSADFAAFLHVDEFVVGYGMDVAGRLRSLPYIAAVSQTFPEASPFR